MGNRMLASLVFSAATTEVVLFFSGENQPSIIHLKYQRNNHYSRQFSISQERQQQTTDDSNNSTTQPHLAVFDKENGSEKSNFVGKQFGNELRNLSEKEIVVSHNFSIPHAEKQSTHLNNTIRNKNSNNILKNDCQTSLPFEPKFDLEFQFSPPSTFNDFSDDKENENVHNNDKFINELCTPFKKKNEMKVLAQNLSNSWSTLKRTSCVSSLTQSNRLSQRLSDDRSQYSSLEHDMIIENITDIHISPLEISQLSSSKTNDYCPMSTLNKQQSLDAKNCITRINTPPFSSLDKQQLRTITKLGLSASQHQQRSPKSLYTNCNQQLGTNNKNFTKIEQRSEWKNCLLSEIQTESRYSIFLDQTINRDSDIVPLKPIEQEKEDLRKFIRENDPSLLKKFDHFQNVVVQENQFSQKLHSSPSLINISAQESSQSSVIYDDRKKSNDSMIQPIQSSLLRKLSNEIIPPSLMLREDKDPSIIEIHLEKEPFNQVHENLLNFILPYYKSLRTKNIWPENLNFISLHASYELIKQISENHRNVYDNDQNEILTQLMFIYSITSFLYVFAYCSLQTAVYHVENIILQNMKYICVGVEHGKPLFNILNKTYTSFQNILHPKLYQTKTILLSFLNDKRKKSFPDPKFLIVVQYESMDLMKDIYSVITDIDEIHPHIYDMEKTLTNFEILKLHDLSVLTRDYNHMGISEYRQPDILINSSTSILVFDLNKKLDISKIRQKIQNIIEQTNHLHIAILTSGSTPDFILSSYIAPINQIKSFHHLNEFAIFVAEIVQQLPKPNYVLAPTASDNVNMSCLSLNTLIDHCPDIPSLNLKGTEITMIQSFTTTSRLKNDKSIKVE
ncbi:unnamed protein product [Didymodactylos carnosus]|uniref:Uncharacterized protein n=1 Tax=Didymodactylos carnosus TaxID=1234261 RepID=A0A813VBA2_9BILA|nr:unnamed protein product [Didymodactylos carnosus]CAF3626097.1 unnamed protein product [Didymodactylos carnosus]